MKMNEKRSGWLKMLTMALLLTGLFIACNDEDDPKPATISAPTVNAATEITATSANSDIHASYEVVDGNNGFVHGDRGKLVFTVS